jgi:uncharacterized protein
MSRQFFINLPVRDPQATTAFYEALGFEFNPAFASPDSACMAINDSAYVMWLSQTRFSDFTEGKPVHDPNAATAVLCAVSVDSREAVDEIVAKALASGGTPHGEPQDHGFMYGNAFTDLDGHGFQFMWMDPKAAAEGPPDMAETA